MTDEIRSPASPPAASGIVALLLALALLVAAALAPAGAAAATKKPRTPPRPLYWGAQIGAQLTGEPAPWDMRAVYRFQHRTKKPLSLISFSAPWADCSGGPCVFQRFPTTPLENIRTYGAIPVFSWSTQGSRGEVTEPDFRLARVTAGVFDGYIREMAEGAREWGHPFFIRLNWEMNGFWFPWSERVNGNGRGSFVAAWRHIHAIFESVGAHNVSWVWCPNVDFTRRLVPLKRLYPGHDYVDWTCLDGFNWGETPNSAGWQSFKEIYAETYNRVKRIARHKPMMIGEIASDDRGGSKPRWIRNMLRVIPARYRKVRALIWYDEPDQGMHWTIDRSPRSARAFANQISRPVFKANEFGDLAVSSPIPPPEW
ncbi:MAG TPA: glycosyl hydrolase [Solirubrobacterales bacterium]